MTTSIETRSIVQTTAGALLQNGAAADQSEAQKLAWTAVRAQIEAVKAAIAKGTPLTVAFSTGTRTVFPKPYTGEIKGTGTKNPETRFFFICTKKNGPVCFNLPQLVKVG